MLAETVPPLATVRIPTPRFPTVRAPELIHDALLPETITAAGLFTALLALPIIPVTSLTDPEFGTHSAAQLLASPTIRLFALVIAPVTHATPPEIVVFPLDVLVPLRVTVPLPDLVKSPLPARTEAISPLLAV